MPESKRPAQLRPETDVLTRGFDPSLSVGSARPAVFRSSTYVFSSPEAAERAFNIMGGRAERTPEESARALEGVIRAYKLRWHKDKVILIGYSRGADALPFMISRLPNDVRSSAVNDTN